MLRTGRGQGRDRLMDFETVFLEKMYIERFASGVGYDGPLAERKRDGDKYRLGGNQREDLKLLSGLTVTESPFSAW